MIALRHALAALALLAAPLAAAGPSTMGLEGRLLDASGDPLNEAATVRISLHTDPSTGGEVWAEEHAVTLQDGYFHADLGLTVPLRPVLVANGPLWVQTAVGGAALGPRTRLNAAPYALSDTLADLSCGEGDTLRFVGGAWACAPLPVSLRAIRMYETAGTHTWTRPAGVTRVEVIVTGGGGGGGSHNSDDAQGGGGAGGTAIEVIDVSAVSSVTVTVGGGGAGQCGNVASGGGTGGTSSFGTYLSATGGAPPTTWAIGGSGGQGSGGDLNLRGNDGGGGNIDGGGNEETGGTGGASYWGGAGRGASAWGTGRNSAHGAGGGGAHASTTNCGYAGGAGVVVVREYGI